MAVNPRTYNSIAGVDIKAVIGPYVLGSIQAISYSIVREKVPVYVMGRVSALGFARGKRAIAGSLIFIMFDQHPILKALSNNQEADRFKYYQDNDEFVPSGTSSFSGQDAQAGLDQVDSNAVSAIGWSPKPVNYVDQIPPFDIVLVGANETGTKAAMKIIGCELLNEGWGISIDDLVSETQYTYVAREVWPWQRQSQDTSLRAAFSSTEASSVTLVEQS